MSTPKSLAVPAAAARVVRAPGATRGANGAVERRATRSPLATRIERELREKPSVRRTSTIRVGTGAERVMVLLQCGNRGARLVAVCAPVARKCVERALAQARYALAARGIELAYSVTPEAACS